MKEKNNICRLVDYYFELKEWDDQPKQFYHRNHISYARHLRPSQNLLVLSNGNIDKAKSILKKVKDWADIQGLEWRMETAIKRYLFIDKEL